MAKEPPVQGPTRKDYEEEQERRKRAAKEIEERIRNVRERQASEERHKESVERGTTPAQIRKWKKEEPYKQHGTFQETARERAKEYDPRTAKGRARILEAGTQSGKRAYAAMEAGAEGMERTLPPGRAPKGSKSVGKIRAARQGRQPRSSGGGGGSITGLDFHNTPDFSGISGNSKEKRHFAGYSMDFGKLPDFSGGGKGGLPDFGQLDNILGTKKKRR